MRLPWSAWRGRTKTLPPSACRPQQQRADNSGAGARHAGYHGQALDEADGKAHGQRIIHHIVIARTQIELIHPEQNETADDQHDADQHRRFKQHALDEAMRQRTDKGGGEEGNQNAEDETPRAGIAGKSVRIFRSFAE